jgi:hypothetical protein
MRTALALAALTGAMLVGGCSSDEGPTPASANARDPLERPLRLPAVPPGGDCPTSAARIVAKAYGPAVGRGPVFAVALGTNATLDIAPAERFGSKEWGGNKVLWLVAGRYHGPVLIRGGRIDAPGLVRFDEGDVPPAQIRLGPDPVADGVGGGWRDRPSYTRVQEPGCYAYPVDGRGFSYAIVFRAVAGSL